MPQVAGQYQLTLTGPATRSYFIDGSPDLQTWQPLTTVANLSGNTDLIDYIEDAQLFFRARPEP